MPINGFLLAASTFLKTSYMLERLRSGRANPVGDDASVAIRIEYYFLNSNVSRSCGEASQGANRA